MKTFRIFKVQFISLTFLVLVSVCLSQRWVYQPEEERISIFGDLNQVNYESNFGKAGKSGNSIDENENFQTGKEGINAKVNDEFVPIILPNFQDIQMLSNIFGFSQNMLNLAGFYNDNPFTKAEEALKKKQEEEKLKKEEEKVEEEKEEIIEEVEPIQIEEPEEKEEVSDNLNGLVYLVDKNSSIEINKSR